MPILAAPVRSLAAIGTRNTFPASVETRTLTCLPGFVLLGVPVYYITQRNDDVPRVFGACKNRVESVLANGRNRSSLCKSLWAIQKQTGRRLWMGGRRDGRGGGIVPISQIVLIPRIRDLCRSLWKFTVRIYAARRSNGLKLISYEYM